MGSDSLRGPVGRGVDLQTRSAARTRVLAKCGDNRPARWRRARHRPHASRGHPELLEQLKPRVRAAQTKVVREANTELLRLYWAIGRALADRRKRESWGAKVVERLAADLHGAFPDQRGLSRSNLFSLRQFAETWPAEAVVQQAVGRRPWGHVTVLLSRSTTSRRGPGTRLSRWRMAGQGRCCSTRSGTPPIAGWVPRPAGSRARGGARRPDGRARPSGDPCGVPRAARAAR